MINQRQFDRFLQIHDSGWRALRWLAAAIAVLACVGSDTLAQSLDTEQDSLRSVMQSNMGSTVNLADRLDALITSTQRAREERQVESNTSDATSGITHHRPVHSDASSSIGQRIDSSGQTVEPSDDGNASRSMSEIRERIRILQRLRRDRSYSMPMIPTIESVPAMQVVPNGMDTTRLSPEPSDNAGMAAINDSLAAETQVVEDVVSMQGEAPPTSKLILSSPVNAMALGESLYRTGNYDSALKAFQSVDADTLSQSDRTWQDLLIALCQRKAGDYEKTNGTLREIANDDSSDYPVKVAKWWLKHAETSHAARTQFDQLSADLDALTERSMKNVTP